MTRYIGALGVLAGWFCIPLSAIFGLLAAMIDYDAMNDPLRSATVYGVPEGIVVAVVGVIAVLAMIPVLVAMVIRDPGPLLYFGALVMGVVGFGLLPDHMGRAYAATLLPGAGLTAIGGWLLHMSALEQARWEEEEEADSADEAAPSALGSAGEPGAPSDPSAAL